MTAARNCSRRRLWTRCPAAMVTMRLCGIDLAASASCRDGMWLAGPPEISSVGAVISGSRSHQTGPAAQLPDRRGDRPTVVPAAADEAHERGHQEAGAGQPLTAGGIAGGDARFFQDQAADPFGFQLGQDGRGVPPSECPTRAADPISRAFHQPADIVAVAVQRVVPCAGAAAMPRPRGTAPAA